MDAQSLLNELYNTKKDIQRAQECLSKLEYKIERITQGQFSNLPKSTTQRDTLDKIADLQEKRIEIITLQTNYNIKLNDYMVYISRLDNPEEIEIIYLRYIEALNWKEVIETLNISKSKVFKVHKRAIYNLNKILKKYSKKTK